jgi:hypothetical protein
MQKKESESSLGGSKINVEEIIHPPKEHIKTPKMLQTVLQVKLWTIQLSTNCLMNHPKYSQTCFSDDLY